MIIEDEIRYYKQLDELQQRLFLGMKTKLLGHSDVRFVSNVFRIDSKTICKVKSELALLLETLSKRIRKSGGGTPKTSHTSRLASTV